MPLPCSSLRERWLRFRLTPWTEVHIQEVAIEAWSDELVDGLAETLKGLLRVEVERRRRGRTSRS